MPKVDVNGIELWYERSGSGHTIVFLHAFALTGAMWLPQVTVLSRAGYQVVCVDLRGHGLSSAPPGPYSLPQLADDVHHLIQKLKLSEVCLVGLSTGGRVATRLALDHPEDISELILVSTKSEPCLEIRTELEELCSIALKKSESFASKQFFNNHYRALANAAPRLMKKFEEGWQDKPGNGFAGVGIAIFSMESVTAKIFEIQVPTLSIAGELDPPCLPYLAWYERSMANCQGIVMPSTGHFVNVEQPEKFNELLLEFLSGQWT